MRTWREEMDDDNSNNNEENQFEYTKKQQWLEAGCLSFLYNGQHTHTHTNKHGFRRQKSTSCKIDACPQSIVSRRSRATDSATTATTTTAAATRAIALAVARRAGFRSRAAVVIPGKKNNLTSVNRLRDLSGIVISSSRSWSRVATMVIITDD